VLPDHLASLVVAAAVMVAAVALKAEGLKAQQGPQSLSIPMSVRPVHTLMDRLLILILNRLLLSKMTRTKLTLVQITISKQVMPLSMTARERPPAWSD